MRTPDSGIALGRQLAARLSPVALAIALLIAAVPSALYLVLESRALHSTATLYARELSERLNAVDQDGRPMVQLDHGRQVATRASWTRLFETPRKLKVSDFPLKAQEGFLEGQPLVVLDPVGDTVLPQGLTELSGIKSFMIVPFTRQGIVAGVLLLDHLVARHDFSPAQVRMALTIAGQAGLALENAHLLTEAEFQAAALKAKNAT